MTKVLANLTERNGSTLKLRAITYIIIEIFFNSLSFLFFLVLSCFCFVSICLLFVFFILLLRFFFLISEMVRVCFCLFNS